ncbi:MAG: tetratricopeptide repeat protein [Terracidiphilus sp.]
MERRRKQLASTLVLASALIAAVATFLLPLSLQAQTQTQPNGIDPALLAKARAGDAASQSVVAHAYMKGEGVPQDYAQAALWYGKAANQGDAKAQFDLGLLYYKGQGVQQDQSQAVSWFRRAADQGDAKAQFALGWHYQHYWGAGQDRAQSVVWYRKAADQGFAKAQFELGKIYFYGDTVSQDLAVAEMWTRKAADQGDVEAQKLLSILVAGETHRREERNVTILVAICLVVFAWLSSVLFRYREKLVVQGRRIMPQTVRSKQLAVLLLVGSWYTACFVYLSFQWEWRFPADAAGTALLYSMPAIIFSAIYLWWLSQAKKDG